MRRRLFDIIQIGNKEDAPSRLFDYLIVGVIFFNIIALFLKTFDALEPAFPVLTVIEYVTTAIFLIEYILRIITADYLYPHYTAAKARLRFLVSFDGIVDLLTIIPAFFLTGFVAFRILRVIRIFHLFRLNSQSDSFQVIINVLKIKWRQILSAIVIILILMLASSLCMYSMEHDAQPDAFPNAFSGIWWSVSCLLTVGYGDIYPITVAGQCFAIVIAFLGVGVVAIPTGIISAGFVEQYSLNQHSEDKLSDLSEIGEIILNRDSDWIGKTATEIQQEQKIQILLVLRDDITIVPTGKLRFIEGDIVVLQSGRLIKS